MPVLLTPLVPLPHVRRNLRPWIVHPVSAEAEHQYGKGSAFSAITLR